MAKMSLNGALDKLNSLSLKAKSEKVTFDEQAEFDALSDALSSFEFPSNGRKVGPAPMTPKNKYFGSKPSGHVFKEPNGNKIQAYKQHEPFLTEATLEPGEVGALIKNMILGGDRLPSGITRLQNTHGSDAAGLLSYSIPTYISKKLYDLARAASVCASAGVQTVPVQGGNVRFLRVTTDCVPEWRGDINNSWHDLTLQAPDVEGVTLTLKSVGALCGLSLELCEDSSNSESHIETIMSRAVATAMDQAILVGSGGTQPIGVVNTSNINLQTSVGSLSDYSEHVDAVGDILNSNYQGSILDLAWIAHPRIRTSLQKLVSSADDQPLIAPSWIQQLKFLTTTTLIEAGNSPDTYLSIIGDFSAAAEVPLSGVRTLF